VAERETLLDNRRVEWEDSIQTRYLGELYINLQGPVEPNDEVQCIAP
jgi:hypothetical protein